MKNPNKRILIEQIHAMGIMLLPLLILFCATTPLAAGSTDISIKAEPQKRILHSGDALCLQVDVIFPEERFLAGYQLGAYLPFVPKAFPEATGIPVKTSKDPRWSSLCISGWQWFRGGQQQPGNMTLEFETKGWPPGDYKLEWRGLFRLRKQTSVESDLYRSAYFYLTVTAP